MLTLRDENKWGKWLTVFFFTVLLIEITSEFFSNKLLLYIFKPLLSIGIMALYWNTSKIRSSLFIIVLFLSMVTNILFIPNTEKFLYIAMIIFMLHRLLLIYYIVKLIKLRDFIPLAIGIIPFLFIFFYLLSVLTEIPSDSYFVLIIQNILISVIGVLAMSEYMTNYSKMNAWLLIFGLFSVVQYFIVFTEKYYLSNLAPITLRPVAMLLNAGVYYAFYRFVIDAETKNAEVTFNEN